MFIVFDCIVCLQVQRGLRRAFGAHARGLVPAARRQLVLPHWVRARLRQAALHRQQRRLWRAVPVIGASLLLFTFLL